MKIFKIIKLIGLMIFQLPTGIRQHIEGARLGIHFARIAVKQLGSEASMSDVQRLACTLMMSSIRKNYDTEILRLLNSDKLNPTDTEIYIRKLAKEKESKIESIRESYNMIMESDK